MPLDFTAMSEEMILQELGQRLERERLNRDVTQQELANQSGVSLRTIKNVESGRGCGVATLIGILRGLGMLNRLEQLLPETPISPIQLAKLKGREKKRASGRRKKTSQPTQVRESQWKWNDE